MKGICKNIIERSVELKITIVNMNEKNINMSLIRENMKVFNAAFIVYILIE